MKRLITTCTLLCILISALPVLAAPLRVYVAEMNAIGVQNKDEMKATLQMLLSSRLSGDKLMAVSSAAEADAVVTGTYVTIGKVFSVDAVAKTVAGKTLTRAFVQGESQDELIPAVGTLADKLSTELGKLNYVDPSVVSSASGVSAVPVPAVIAPFSTPKTEIIKAEQQVHKAPVGEFIKPPEYERNSTSGWQSKRLNGAANLMAIGATRPDGSLELFLAEDRRLSYYRKGSDMKLIAETEFSLSEKIISLDTLDDGNGNLDVYVTMIRADELSSEIWQVKGDALVKKADNLPYFFRAFSLAGGPKKLYVQSMGRDADYYGDVSEAVRVDSKIIIKSQIKMPRYADIYSFNQFRDPEGKIFTLAINPDGYLIVYDQNLVELWRSNDKFGGSELFFQKEDANVRVTGDKFRWIFMNQRVQITSKGEVLVGKNDGFWVIGNARSYKKGAVYNLVWNGSSLEEKWRTRDTQNYMPDYFYDEARNELFMLQTVQRPGITGRGASSLSIKKVD